MTYSIGIAGKGGTGKTTLAGFLVRYLVENNLTPVLAVDADSNANFNEVLGLEVKETLGDAREEMKKGVSTGMTKDIFMEMKLEQAVVESEGFDLIVMGRPEGPGCYCAANTLLTQYLERLIGNYAYVVIDNEAGMEHISRLTTNNIDLLLIISDPTTRGIKSAGRILELTDELSLNINDKLFIINQVKDDNIGILKEYSENCGLNLVGTIPEDPIIREYDMKGMPTMKVEEESIALKSAFDIFSRIFASIRGTFS